MMCGLCCLTILDDNKYYFNLSSKAWFYDINLPTDSNTGTLIITGLSWAMLCNFDVYSKVTKKYYQTQANDSSILRICRTVQKLY